MKTLRRSYLLITILIATLLIFTVFSVPVHGVQSAVTGIHSAGEVESPAKELVGSTYLMSADGESSSGSLKGVSSQYRGRLPFKSNVNAIALLIGIVGMSVLTLVIKAGGHVSGMVNKKS